jgi:hypothetical protein
MRRIVLFLWLAAAACAPVRPPLDYTKLVAANPKAILIVPPVNKSVDLDAPAYFLSTLPVPLAERGYYVFPVNVVKRLLEDDGLSDAAMVHAADPVRLCQMFGADAVLYPTIEEWTAKYWVLSTTVQVEFTYVLKDCKVGEEIWRGFHARSESSSTQNLLTDLVAAAITKANPNYMKLAREANAIAVAYPGPGLPAGPYRPEHRRDLIARPASAVSPEQAASPTTAPDPASAVPGEPRS